MIETFQSGLAKLANWHPNIVSLPHLIHRACLSFSLPLGPIHCIIKQTDCLGGISAATIEDAELACAGRTLIAGANVTEFGKPLQDGIEPGGRGRRTMLGASPLTKFHRNDTSSADEPTTTRDAITDESRSV